LITTALASIFVPPLSNVRLLTTPCESELDASLFPSAPKPCVFHAGPGQDAHSPRRALVRVRPPARPVSPVPGTSPARAALLSLNPRPAHCSGRLPPLGCSSQLGLLALNTYAQSWPRQRRSARQLRWAARLANCDAPARQSVTSSPSPTCNQLRSQWGSPRTGRGSPPEPVPAPLSPPPLPLKAI
jgi:hypothetical protein